MTTETLVVSMLKCLERGVCVVHSFAGFLPIIKRHGKLSQFQGLGILGPWWSWPNQKTKRYFGSETYLPLGKPLSKEDIWNAIPTTLVPCSCPCCFLASPHFYPFRGSSSKLASLSAGHSFHLQAHAQISFILPFFSLNHNPIQPIFHLLLLHFIMSVTCILALHPCFTWTGRLLFPASLSPHHLPWAHEPISITSHQPPTWKRDEMRWIYSAIYRKKQWPRCFALFHLGVAIRRCHATLEFNHNWRFA